MKSSVNDVFSITSCHYLYAGSAGVSCFHFLNSSLIEDINNIKLKELNATHSCILSKGRLKNRNSERLYRTISTCPLLAKALDCHVRESELPNWIQAQPDTQFQGEGSSHELAALLLTETIIHSLYTANQPIYILYLDMKSCFDRVIPEILPLELFSVGTCGENLLYIVNRLKERNTVLEWDKVLMGPIDDEVGVEQGGISEWRLL